MNMKKMKIATLALCALMLIPASSEAYVAQKQSAFALSDTQALYVIEYAFGTQKNDFYLPRFPQAGLTHADTGRQLGYEIIKDNAAAASEAETMSVILSTTRIEGDFYVIPAGTNATFTLVVVAETQPDWRDAEYTLQVTSLPYFVGADQTRRTTNQVLLRDYRTPGVELNTARPISSAVHTLSTNIL